ncbi:MAG TPA: ParB/RepB/Spo0J family partition protein [Acidimicrobiia bacterium]|nr:ParB/RepB/Spo0J family partition protein [Acidimicrobiia bacterium]
MARPGGLGKGLGALIPTSAVTDAPVGLEELPVAAIRPNPQQPREHFDEEALGALAESIREVGVLQPVLVRPDGDAYELIAGERRWRAARRVGLQSIPALVRTADNLSVLQQAIIENVQRESLNAIEEAAAYQQLIEDFGLTHDEVAARVGRSRASVTNTLRLLQLPPTIQRYVKEGSLRMGHARALLGTPDRSFQEQLAKRVVHDELSVREVEEAIRARSEDPRERTPATRSPKLRPPGLLELEELLGDLLETRVSISMGPKRGKVQIDFATLEDLERIYRVMAGPTPSTGSAGANGSA